MNDHKLVTISSFKTTVMLFPKYFLINPFTHYIMALVQPSVAKNILFSIWHILNPSYTKLNSNLLIAKVVKY